MITKPDSIIAVKNVLASSEWYQSVFGCKSLHGGNLFDVLVSDNNEVLLCLHKWGEDNHPTMNDQSITAGNGLIIYFRTEDMTKIRENVDKMSIPIEEEIHYNPNSMQNEFSIRDLDGYYITISEYHKYEG